MIILLATLTCRKFSIIGKYDVNRNGKPPTVLLSSDPPAAALNASNGGGGQNGHTNVVVPGSIRPPTTRQQVHLYSGVPTGPGVTTPSNTGETSLSSGGTLGHNGHNNGNGNGTLHRPRRGHHAPGVVGRGTQQGPANTIITGSSTALVPPEMGDPFGEMGVVNEVTAPVRQRVMNVMQRTYEYGGIRAPRELWLV